MTKLLRFSFLYLICCLTSAHAMESEKSLDQLISFQTDYCTGYPEGTSDQPELWKHCCLQHDLYFWAGGDQANRDNSDLILRECIAATGSRLRSRLVYIAVRAGSYSPIKFSGKKWNFGWPARPTHQTLTKADIDMIEKELQGPSYSFIPTALKDGFLSELRSR